MTALPNTNHAGLTTCLLPDLEKLRNEIEKFLSETGLSPTTFGIRYARDPGFVFGLRKGREPRTAKRMEVLENMRKPAKDFAS